MAAAQLSNYASSSHHIGGRIMVDSHYGLPPSGLGKYAIYFDRASSGLAYGFDE